MDTVTTWPQSTRVATSPSMSSSSTVHGVAPAAAGRPYSASRPTHTITGPDPTAAAS